jgi:allantoate deiminase
VTASKSHEVIERCLALARISEEPGRLTRTFLSTPTREVHGILREWMTHAEMLVELDSAGNLRGTYAGREVDGARLLIGSHVDTVPGAGAFDGILGVVIGIALVEALNGRRLRFGIEVIAFSEEEGVRFGVPFLGSRALAGTFDPTWLERRDKDGKTVAQVIREFGLDPSLIPLAAVRGAIIGYLEFHIEQGPLLESLDLPLGVVEAIVGQSRLEIRFIGKANHAGTTPMHLRKDALTGAAEWVGTVERMAFSTPGLVATVGQIEARPGAGNVIPGEVTASLDVRHASDDIRSRAFEEIVVAAQDLAARRGLMVECETRLNQPAVNCDRNLVRLVEQAVESAGYPVHRMASGAGHDAMVLAEKMPVAMLFLRSPGGISHHPDESVLAQDVEAALQAGMRFLEELDAR